MLRVGLTGGIAAGKSEVARRLAGHGAVIIDADRLAREVVAVGTPGYAAVVDRFGPEVLLSDGGIDRPRLAALIFGDDAARADLNAIVHPLVRAAAAAQERAAPADAIVVHDVPLLVETGQQDDFDVVVVVSAAPELQLERLIRQRGMAPDAAQARLAAQAPLADKIAVADIVIENDDGLDELDRQVEACWLELAARRRDAD